MLCAAVAWGQFLSCPEVFIYLASVLSSNCNVVNFFSAEESKGWGSWWRWWWWWRRRWCWCWIRLKLLHRNIWKLQFYADKLMLPCDWQLFVWSTVTDFFSVSLKLFRSIICAVRRVVEHFQVCATVATGDSFVKWLDFMLFMYWKTLSYWQIFMHEWYWMSLGTF